MLGGVHRDIIHIIAHIGAARAKVIGYNIAVFAGDIDSLGKGIVIYFKAFNFIGFQYDSPFLLKNLMDYVIIPTKGMIFMYKFFKKHGENDSCRYCKKATAADGEYFCKRKGKVNPTDVCRFYEFNPFAPRVKRVRHLDTTMFDPLDFKID